MFYKLGLNSLIYIYIYRNLKKYSNKALFIFQKTYEFFWMKFWFNFSYHKPCLINWYHETYTINFVIKYIFDIKKTVVIKLSLKILRKWKITIAFIW